MNYRFLFTLLLLVTLLALLPMVIASAGVRGPSPAERTFDFEPGKVIRLSFYIHGSDHLDLTVKGGLQEHAEILDTDPNGGPRKVPIELTLPDSLSPGEHILYVGAIERGPEGEAMFGGRAGALMGIYIKVLADGPAIEASLDVPPIGVDQQTAEATVAVESWSKQQLDIRARVILRDGEQVLHDSAEQSAQLPSNEEHSFTFSMPVGQLQRGHYPVEAVIEYGANTTRLEGRLRVGEKNLFLDGYEKELSVGKINKFSFVVVSDWNRELEGVYGVVFLEGEEAAKSPTTLLTPFDREEFVAYIDATELEARSYEGLIQLYFDGERKNFPINVTFVAEETPAAASAKEEKASAGAQGNSSLLLLYAALILLVLINLFLLFRRERKKEPPKESSKEASERQPPSSEPREARGG